MFGELVPKRLAMKKSEKIAMGLSGPLRFVSVLFAPLVWFLSVSTNLVLRLCGVDPHEKEEVSEVRWFALETCLRAVRQGAFPHCIYEEELRMVAAAVPALFPGE